MTMPKTKISARGARRGREQRRLTMPTLEIRAAADGSATDVTLTGYACVTDTPYAMGDMWGEYNEIVRSGSFRNVATDDVRLLMNHEGIALARTKSETLKLREITNKDDDPLGLGTTGLWVEASLDPTSTIVNDIRSAMSRGDLDEMSFAFQVLEQEWSPDYSQRDISSVKLFDVSVVTYPANPSTSASIRSMEEQIDEMTQDEIRSAMARLQARLVGERHPRSLFTHEAQALASRQ